MPLRPDIADLKQDVISQLTFDGQVVLIRILQPQIGRELPEESHGPELRPVNRLSSRRIQNAVERIGKGATTLADIGSLQKGTRDEIASAEWRFRTELLQNELLDWIVENSIAHADAGLARAARESAEKSVFPA